jgi:ATP-binding cassette subfamily B protein
MILQTRAYAGTVTVLSSLPTRYRWRVPFLVNQRSLSSAVAADLGGHPSVREASVNSLTGGVLLKLTEETGAATATEWLRAAIGRQLNAMLDTSIRHDAPVLPVLPRSPAGARPLQRLLDVTERHRGLRQRAIALSLANGLEDAVPPLVVGLAADTAVMGSSSLLARIGFSSLSSRLFALGGLGAGLWLISAGIEYLKSRAVSRLANEVRYDLRTALYEHIQTLDISDVESRDVSDWMAILDNDVNQVNTFFKSGADPFFSMTTNMAVAGGTLLLISPAMAGMQLLLLPALVMTSISMIKPIRQTHRLAQVDQDRLNLMLSGNVSGMSTVASFNAQNEEAARVRDAGRRYFDSSIEAEKAQAAYVPVLRTIAGAGFITSLVWGTSKVAAGTASVGVIDAMAMTQLRLLSALARMGVGLEQYQKTAVALERIFETLDTTPSVLNGTRPLAPAQITGEVRFTDVVFGYDPARPVLKSLTMNCPAGKTTGIVGASGAGKSTLLKLFMRFWDPQSGRVELDGVDVRDFNVSDLRRSIALVSQQITLFNGTIRDNISYGRRDATAEEVVEAARVAEAHDFIMSMPHGYDSPIGFGGLSLSGGQRQRIAIARAVLADRPILLFDEATSALDHATEAALQRSLEAVTRRRTTLMVAHRLSTVRHADVIYVIDEGVIREHGTHEQLVARDGIYAGMWRVQTGERPRATPKALRAANRA